MIDNRDGEILHNRSTRGETLSAEEEQRLSGWYASRDSLEANALRLDEPGPAQSIANGFLKEQIDAALSQLTQVTHRIREIASQNDSLRREIALLRRQLASQSPRAI